MFLRTSAVSRRQLMKESVMGEMELLRSESLTMMASDQSWHNTFKLKFIPTEMIIGFSQRIQTVSEGMIHAELFELQIDVVTLRTSEREQRMIFRYRETSSTATVVPLTEIDQNFDVLFGTRRHDSLVVEIDLPPLSNAISPLSITIRNEFDFEGEECFTIRISSVDFSEQHEFFSCNEDIDGGNSYFCEHTICIADDDGGCLNFCIIL